MRLISTKVHIIFLQEDIKTLLFHFVEQHISEFDDVDYVKTFANLRLKYDQHKDREKEQAKSLVGGSPINPPPVWKRDQRELDKDEEGWFNEDDEVRLFVLAVSYVTPLSNWKLGKLSGNRYFYITPSATY